MKIEYNWIWAVLGVLFFCSCAKEPEEPRTFETVRYTQTNQIVQKTEIELEPEKYVEVDFNADGLMDLAVIEEPDDAALQEDQTADDNQLSDDKLSDEDSGNETPHVEKAKPSKNSLFNMFKKQGITIPRSQLTIYIQEAGGKYYLGGKIIDVKEGEIIGLAYKQNDTDYYDLLLVYEYDEGQTEVVRYENDGSGFTLLGQPEAE